MEFTYPMFVIIESATGRKAEGSATFRGMQHLALSNGTNAVAVFRSQEVAEAYQKKCCPDSMLYAIPDTGMFAGILTFASKVGPSVVFDPDLAGHSTQPVRIDSFFVVPGDVDGDVNPAG